MYNKSLLVGRATKNFELKTTKTGKYLCDFQLAVDKYGDGANFISCQVWGKSAEFLAKYGTKGSIVIVDGSIETNNYNDKDGKTVYKTYVLANQVKLVGGKSDTSQEEQSNETDPFAPKTSEDTTDPFASQTKVVDDPFSSSGKSLASEEDLPF